MADATTKAALLRSIRADLAFFGLDVSSLSDDQLERGLVNFAKAVAGAGLTVEEAGSAFKNLRDEPEEAING